MVGVQGFEPWTPCSQSRCATRLRYTPTEPIFYTERAITGKYCKIRPMSAYFSSKFTKQIHAILTAGLLVLCLLGTHWIGFSHSISHSQIQSHADVDSTSSDKQSSLSHSSDVCHLFDALTLAGFVLSQPLNGIAHHLFAFLSLSSDTSLFAQATIEHYQSRAPPTLLL